MQPAAGVLQRPLSVGLGFGLVAGMVGIGQWILTQRDLAERLAAFNAAQRKDPSFFDATNVVRGNEWFWLGTAAVAAVLMLASSWCAAFAASLMWQRVRDGVQQGLVAAAISGVIYVVATYVAISTSPAPDVTATLPPCELVLGVVYIFTACLVVLAGAGMGMGVRGLSLRGSRASY